MEFFIIADGTKQKVVNFLVLVLFVAVFISSYLVIWQPVYNLSEEQYAEEEPDEVISDETNAYLVKQKDGSYIFYFEGYEIPVPKEDFDAGYYDGYPVKEK